MSMEKWNRSKVDAAEAPMVHIDEFDKAIPLNKEAELLLRELDEKEKKDLRDALVRTGSPNILRNTLAAIGLAGIAATTPAVFNSYKDTIRKNESSTSADDSAAEEQTDSNSSFAPLSSLHPEARPSFFETMDAPSPYVDGYAATIGSMTHLQPDQVLFTNQLGTLLSTEPVQLTPAAGYTPYEMTVSYSGGEPVGIPRDWSFLQKEHMAEAFLLPVEEVHMVHVYRALAKASDVEAESLAEVVERRIQNIEQTEGKSFQQMLQDNFSLSINTIDQAQINAGLQRLIPGLIAQESLYNTTVISRAGAEGPMQIMPDTWEKYADEGMDIHSLQDSLVVASRYFEASYNYLTRNLTEEFSYIEQEYFNGNHEAFVENFLILLLINGYNAGDGNMRKVVEWFFATYPGKQSLEDAFGNGKLVNKDIYFAMAHLAREQTAVPSYGDHASRYPFRVVGWSRV